MTLSEQKRLAREEASAVRRHLAAEGGAEPALQVASHLSRLLDRLRTIGPVSGYWPIRTELDIRPAMHELERRGFELALPLVVSEGAALAFRGWGQGDPLLDGDYGIPVPEEAAPLVTPTLGIAPLLAYDRRGNRLGYGGGFYDRTLAELRDAGEMIAVGAAFAGQLVDAVPTDALDEALDFIVTDRGIWDPRWSPKRSDEEGFL